jgi:hypothetical protein
MLAMTGLLHIFDFVAVAAGLFAFILPLSFYDLHAKYTDQTNVHLVRDVGAAYISAGLALSWAALVSKWRPPLVSLAGCFLLLHAFGHVIDIVSGQAPMAHDVSDAVQVFGPALVVCSLAGYFLQQVEKSS